MYRVGPWGSPNSDPGRDRAKGAGTGPDALQRRCMVGRGRGRGAGTGPLEKAAAFGVEIPETILRLDKNKESWVVGRPKSLLLPGRPTPN